MAVLNHTFTPEGGAVLMYTTASLIIAATERNVAEKRSKIKFVYTTGSKA